MNIAAIVQGYGPEKILRKAKLFQQGSCSFDQFFALVKNLTLYAQAEKN